MLLLPTEQAMFKKMGHRDMGHRLAVAGSIGAFAALMLWGTGLTGWQGLYYALMGAVVAAVCSARCRKLKREIMPVSDCFIRLEGGRLTVRQPAKDGKYEGCSVLLSWIAQVEPGSRYKVPSLYIALREDAPESSIEDQGAAGRRIFLVSGEGYGRKEFISLYKSFCGQLPDSVEHGNLKMPEDWGKEPVDLYMVFLWLLPALLAVPVIFYLIL